MTVLFRGVGVVYIPIGNRFIRFVDGQYTTSDDDEIAVLSKRYTPDILDAPALVVEDAPVQEDESPAVEDAPEREDKPRRGRPRSAK